MRKKIMKNRTKIWTRTYTEEIILKKKNLSIDLSRIKKTTEENKVPSSNLWKKIAI